MEKYHTLRVILAKPGEPPLSAEMRVSDMQLSPERTTLVSVQVGDGPAYGGVTLPMDVLTILMSKVVETSEKGPPVVLPPRGIIMPN